MCSLLDSREGYFARGELTLDILLCTSIVLGLGDAHASLHFVQFSRPLHSLHFNLSRIKWVPLYIQWQACEKALGNMCIIGVFSYIIWQFNITYSSIMINLGKRRYRCVYWYTLSAFWFSDCDQCELRLLSNASVQQADPQVTYLEKKMLRLHNRNACGLK